VECSRYSAFFVSPYVSSRGPSRRTPGRPCTASPPGRVTTRPRRRPADRDETGRRRGRPHGDRERGGTPTRRSRRGRSPTGSASEGAGHRRAPPTMPRPSASREGSSRKADSSGERVEDHGTEVAAPADAGSRDGMPLSWRSAGREIPPDDPAVPALPAVVVTVRLPAASRCRSAGTPAAGSGPRRGNGGASAGRRGRPRGPSVNAGRSGSPYFRPVSPPVISPFPLFSVLIII
jgi:hypothetical protein